MINIEESAIIMLKRVDVQDILDGRITYDWWQEKDFARISAVYMKQYSSSELMLLYRCISDYVKERDFDMNESDNGEKLNFFHIIFYLSERLLTFSGNKISVFYGKLLEWRKLTLQVNEDTFSCAFLAAEGRGDECKNLMWDTVLSHNNIHLTRILERGISENHFHLWASAPYFHLTWVTMMNNTSEYKIYDKLFSEMDQEKSYVNYHYQKRYQEQPFRVQRLQAMLIRAYLYCWLEDKCEIIGEYLSKDVSAKDIDCFIAVKNLLENPEELIYYENNIFQMVRGLRSYMASFANGYTIYEDYVQEQLGEMKSLSDAERFCCGERWFLCRMFSCIYKFGHCFIEQFNWFYAYLAIKEEFRSELVQVNDRIGLINFQRYSSRKGQLPVRQDYLCSMALKDALRCEYLNFLEARISPCDSAEENRDYVKMLDSMIDEEERKRCFYVFHFVRKEECTSDIMLDISCRHAVVRRLVKKQASALIRFREKYPETAARVRGIDVCSSEIGCRPEVFAQAFRYLKNHVAQIEGWNTVETVPQLRITYHVGEDFLDIVDGLRAIDEAVRFLDMDCGDRLGHAIVLGTDVKKWYRDKNYRIILPLQDYVDNLAWMYGKFVHFGVEGMDHLMHQLESEFERSFRLLYGDSLPEKNMDFTIMLYYYSELLRGDAPECYFNGMCEELDMYMDKYDMYALNKKKNEKKDIRKIREVNQLYYLYHYDRNVKKKGQQIREINISNLWIKGVSVLQKKMCRFVADRGLAIETNPSSNIMISGIGKYEEHPIVKLYNHHLISDEKKLAECPQLSVSVNTDDKGIFATSLENEYALLASALEQKRNEDDTLAYDRTMIYEWLDQIREFGNMQSFGRR